MKLTNESAVIPNICPLCNQHREKDEYCMLVISENESRCVIKKKTNWSPQQQKMFEIGMQMHAEIGAGAVSDFVYIPPEAGEPIMQKLSLGYKLNTGPHLTRTDKKRYIKIKRFGKSYRHRVHVLALAYGRILNDHWVDNWRE